VCDRPLESQQGRVRGWLIAQLAAVFLTTVIRLYSCWKVKGGLYAEDYLIIVVCCICGYMSSLLFLSKCGLSWLAIADLNLSQWLTKASVDISIKLDLIAQLQTFISTVSLLSSSRCPTNATQSGWMN
jgi:hypothetical protein